jgi:hypothetical protein
LIHFSFSSLSEYHERIKTTNELRSGTDTKGIHRKCRLTEKKFIGEKSDEGTEESQTKRRKEKSRALFDIIRSVAHWTMLLMQKKQSEIRFGIRAVGLDGT